MSTFEESVNVIVPASITIAPVVDDGSIFEYTPDDEEDELEDDESEAKNKDELEEDDDDEEVEMLEQSYVL